MRVQRGTNSSGANRDGKERGVGGSRRGASTLVSGSGECETTF